MYVYIYICAYTRRSIHPSMQPTIRPYEGDASISHLLPRRTRRSPEAQKLTREAGSKIVSPILRLPLCYGGRGHNKSLTPTSKTKHAKRQWLFCYPAACTEFGTPLTPPHSNLCSNPPPHGHPFQALCKDLQTCRSKTLTHVSLPRGLETDAGGYSEAYINRWSIAKRI